MLFKIPFICIYLIKLDSRYKRFGAVIITVNKKLRKLPKKHFQTKLHSFLLDTLKKHDDYIDISQITSALKTYK